MQDNAVIKAMGNSQADIRKAVESLLNSGKLYFGMNGEYKIRGRK